MTMAHYPVLLGKETGSASQGLYGREEDVSLTHHSLPTLACLPACLS